MVVSGWVHDFYNHVQLRKCRQARCRPLISIRCNLLGKSWRATQTVNTRANHTNETPISHLLILSCWGYTEDSFSLLLLQKLIRHDFTHSRKIIVGWKFFMVQKRQDFGHPWVLTCAKIQRFDGIEKKNIRLLFRVASISRNVTFKLKSCTTWRHISCSKNGHLTSRDKKNWSTVAS